MLTAAESQQHLYPYFLFLLFATGRQDVVEPLKKNKSYNAFDFTE